MDQSKLFTLYRQLQNYVNWQEDDVDRLEQLKPLVQPTFESIVDDFYEEIARQPAARQVITGGERQIAALKQTLLTWLENLFTGPFDEGFVERRFRVGHRHIEIGLAPYFPLVALARIRAQLMSEVINRWTGSAGDLAKAVGSLNRILDLDLTIIEIAYQTEATRREQNQARLAMLGQVSAGIAHELRNPLNAVKTSVYFLLNAESPSAEKVAEHLQRIDRQVEISDAVITALSRFAKLPAPRLLPMNLCDFVLHTLANNPLPEHIELVLECPDRANSPCVLGDQDQLVIVLGNLIRNACDAMSETETRVLKIQGREQPAGDVESNISTADRTLSKSSTRRPAPDTPPGRSSSRFALTVTDSGCGISPEHVERVMEPLFSTKTRGLGLGLALSREIMNRHGGTITITTQPGIGTSVTIVLDVVTSAESKR